MTIERSLKWSLAAASQDQLPTYVMEGSIGEDASLEELAADIDKPIRLDMFGVTRINSTGVREWLRFVRSIDRAGPHRLSRCSVPVVAQLNMIYNFRGSAVVESVIAPFYCEACNESTTAEVRIRDTQPDLPKVCCAECSGAMALDEVAGRYFLFLTY